MEAFEFIAVGSAFFDQGMAADPGEDPFRLLGAQGNAQIALIGGPHGVGAGMLAQHQAVLAAHFGRVEALLVEGILQQAIDMDA